MTRIRCAWELNDLTVRMVRNMLLHDDIDSLLETGSGMPEEAALMVRCYELAAMELWDESALIEAATVAGIDHGFTLSGESPERIYRKITIAIKTRSAPEYMPPHDGIKLLYRLGVLVYDELEETVNHFAAMGRYDTTEPQQTAPDTDTAPPAPVVSASDEPAIPNWKMLIQAEATALILRLRNSGANPTKHSILGSMAQWCLANGIKTDGGIFPSEGYLRTHVLGGRHWDVPR